MNISIIYESKHGNGKEAMTYLRDVLQKKGFSVQLTSVHEVDPRSPPEADVYVFSAPNRFGSVIRSMRKFLEKLEMRNPKARYLVVNTFFGNPAESKGLSQMEKILEQKTMTKISNGLMLQVMSLKGPLETGYQKKLDEFAQQIQSSSGT